MSHFQPIKANLNGKSYKIRNAQIECAECSSPIHKTGDYFKLNLHWKIKKNPDEKYFCTLKCIKEWCKD
jgi:hypothetical protein